MIAEMMAEYGGRLLVAIAGVGLGFIALIAVLKFLRQRNGPSPFVRGGKARVPRLQVVDAAAIDTRRRLVLVRRDDREHLIMIGGPADIIVESNIVTAEAPQARAPSAQLAAPLSAADGFGAPEIAAPAPRPARPPEVSTAAVPPPSAEKTPAARPVRRPPETQERPQPVTPQAAYLEASDDFTPSQRPATPPASAAAGSTSGGDPAALKEAEEHLEAMKRRMLSQEAPPVRPRPETEKPATSGFARVLDEEMKAPLRDAPRPVPAAIQQMPLRTPRPAPAEKPPEEEADIQDEIARIFGEKR
ncbi:flagellar biosynthetic protein FliO [Rhizobiaceae bacterium BDR2-2]|uniref:Flagellar biosynthetic protein FliO n=1 Tax=Ectorhizobium quercum TaxID=2965071 RepID=A0AAE3SVH6_9HYPH|nr:flagellar biosynthetic protein FliO [Ectorhizobium quercum]MCX8997673.1 flagellar biosynthetic protein FliO [Ectorhizobium quercum]